MISLNVLLNKCKSDRTGGQNSVLLVGLPPESSRSLEIYVRSHRARQVLKGTARERARNHSTSRTTEAAKRGRVSTQRGGGYEFTEEEVEVDRFVDLIGRRKGWAAQLVNAWITVIWICHLFVRGTGLATGRDEAQVGVLEWIRTSDNHYPAKDGAWIQSRVA